MSDNASIFSDYISDDAFGAQCEEAGIPASKRTRERWRRVGAGPPFIKFGTGARSNKILYHREKARKWLESLETA